MNRTKKLRAWPILCVRVALLVLAAALLLLCPTNYYSHHWSDSVSWTNSIVLTWTRVQLLTPLCWGLAVFLLLGCLEAWLRRKAVPIRVPKGVRVAAIVLAVVLLVIGAYASWGFVRTLSAPRPIPFEVGMWFMQHSAARALWWCVSAAALHLALLPSRE